MSDPYLPPGCSQSQIDHWNGGDDSRWHRAYADAETELDDCDAETLFDMVGKDAVLAFVNAIKDANVSNLSTKFWAARHELLSAMADKMEAA